MLKLAFDKLGGDTLIGCRLPLRPIAHLVIASLVLTACGKPAPPSSPPVAPSVALAEHGKEFRKEIIKVTDGVYVAVGYGIANSILLDGTDGFIVVDTLETVEDARIVNAEFRKIVGAKPLKAIIYTHNHPDHTFGAAGFVQPGEQPVIYAQEKINEALDQLITEFRAVISRRSLRMYGYWLSGDALGNVGVGPFLAVHEGSTLSILRPTRTFADRLEETVAGVHFELHSAPGETDDTLYVWLPEKKTLLCADNYYKAFPNLYTIRGTPYRSPRRWADSVDQLRAVHAELLVPGHSRPLRGADTIYAALTDYRDAIRYVYDQTVRGINAGLTPDELVERVKLPEHLAKSPYLQEFYGTVPWGVRAIFDGSLGWFDGNPTSLQPLGPADEAQHLAQLAGGAGALAKNLDDAIASKDWQWALQVSDWLLRLHPDDAHAKEQRVKALTARGEAEANPNARHYYLMSALELAGNRKLPDQVTRATPAMLRQMPLKAFFNGMAVNLDAQASAALNQKVAFEFTDTQEAWTVWVRRGVVELQPAVAADADLHVKVSAQVFKEMLARLRNPALTIAQEFEVVKGNKLAFANFMKLFKPADAG